MSEFISFLGKYDKYIGRADNLRGILHRGGARTTLRLVFFHGDPLDLQFASPEEAEEAFQNALEWLSLCVSPRSYQFIPGQDHNFFQKAVDVLTK